MVTTPVDPIRVPTLNLSEEELSDIEMLIETGALPKDFLDRHFEAVEKNVFGHDVKHDKRGDPIEQGIGSAGNMTQNCIAAYKKYCNPDNPKAAEPDTKGVYDATLARMQAQLKECDARRAAARERHRGKRRKAV